MDKSKETKQLVGGLLEQQMLAVLASCVADEQQPYTSIVGFAATGDLEYLLFATRRETRKYENMMRSPKVALLIDNRSHSGRDFHEAVAVTALGSVEEIDRKENAEMYEEYRRQCPHLSDFAAAPTTALMRVRVSKYLCVSKFQNVTELIMSECAE